jgi:hypothetical protein
MLELLIKQYIASKTRAIWHATVAKTDELLQIIVPEIQFSSTLLILYWQPLGHPHLAMSES